MLYSTFCLIFNPLQSVSSVTVVAFYIQGLFRFTQTYTFPHCCLFHSPLTSGINFLLSEEHRLRLLSMAASKWKIFFSPLLFEKSLFCPHSEGQVVQQRICGWLFPSSSTLNRAFSPPLLLFNYHFFVGNFSFYLGFS